jgi:hypothetical protein
MDHRRHVTVESENPDLGCQVDEASAEELRAPT